MTQEQIKSKAKEYFPNDEFKQQIVIDAINWATKELQKENAELKLKLEALEGQTPWKDIKDKSEVIGQLFKAKELLRELIDTPVFNQMGGELYENEGYTELVEEVEQFLEEMKEK